MKTLNRLTILCLAAFCLLACGRAPHTAQDHTAQDHTANDPERITIDQVLAKIERGEPITFLDSRNDHAWEHAEEKIPGALRVRNNSDLRQLLTELPKETFVVTYCT